MLLGFIPPLVPCLQPGLAATCSTSRGWGNTGVGRHLLEVQIALGSLLGGLGSDLLFLSWEVAISFALFLGCGRGHLSGRDVCVPGVHNTAGSWVGRGFVVSGLGSVVLLGPASSAIRTDDLRSMR